MIGFWVLLLLCYWENVASGAFLPQPMLQRQPGQRHCLGTQNNSPETCTESTTPNPLSQLTIRPCRFDDLRNVADMIAEGFHGGRPRSLESFHSEVWGDLVEDYFDDDDDDHFMFVAEWLAENRAVVVGFADIDNREDILEGDPPLPFLSDLVVHKDYRRRGIGRELVLHCERVSQRQMRQSQMYTRVRQSNKVALKMYCESLQYQTQSHPVFGVKDKNVLLGKEFPNKTRPSVLQKTSGNGPSHP